MVVEAAQPATKAPVVVVAQVTAVPEATEEPEESLTVTCKGLLRAEPAVTLWLFEAVTTEILAGGPTVAATDRYCELVAGIPALVPPPPPPPPLIPLAAPLLLALLSEDPAKPLAEVPEAELFA